MKASYCQLALALLIGIQIGIRLPAAKKGAEQFRDTVASRIINDISVTIGEAASQAIREKYFNGEAGERKDYSGRNTR